MGTKSAIVDAHNPVKQLTNAQISLTALRLNICSPYRLSGPTRPSQIPCGAHHRLDLDQRMR